jgi:hypothetical protein
VYQLCCSRRSAWSLDRATARLHSRAADLFVEAEEARVIADALKDTNNKFTCLSVNSACCYTVLPCVSSVLPLTRSIYRLLVALIRRLLSRVLLQTPTSACRVRA